MTTGASVDLDAMTTGFFFHNADAFSSTNMIVCAINFMFNAFF